MTSENKIIAVVCVIFLAVLATVFYDILTENKDEIEISGLHTNHITADVETETILFFDNTPPPNSVYCVNCSYDVSREYYLSKEYDYVYCDEYEEFKVVCYVR